jgi:hypothetical protein
MNEDIVNSDVSQANGETSRKRRSKRANLPLERVQGKAVKSGLWVSFEKAKIDGRCRLAKTMAMLRKEFVNHCGGSPTVGEAILIERIIAKTIKCFLYERGVLTDPAGSMGSKDHYLACANSLRLDLTALGLEKQIKDLPGDLDSYLQENYKK